MHYNCLKFIYRLVIRPFLFGSFFVRNLLSCGFTPGDIFWNRLRLLTLFRELVEEIGFKKLSVKTELDKIGVISFLCVFHLLAQISNFAPSDRTYLFFKEFVAFQKEEHSQTYYNSNSPALRSIKRHVVAF